MQICWKTWRERNGCWAYVGLLALMVLMVCLMKKLPNYGGLPDGKAGLMAKQSLLQAITRVCSRYF